MIDPVSRYLHQRAGMHGPVMLAYHAVTPNNSSPIWPWAVSMRQFRKQLDFLAAEGYTTPTVRELVAAPADKWQGRTAVITFDDGYVDNLAACEELQQRGMRASWFIVSGSIGQPPNWPDDGRPAGRLLNANELRDMRENGMEIGSHTVTHTRLTSLSDAQLMRELTDSKTALEDLLGSPVDSFAYPFGDSDVRCANAVQQAAYTAACTTRTGWALRDKTPYQLRRLTVFNTDTQGSFVRKLSFGSHDVRWRDIARREMQRLSRS